MPTMPSAVRCSPQKLSFQTRGRTGSAPRKWGWWNIGSSPTRLEVRHIRAPGQSDVDLDELLGRKTA